ncbi:MAG TPA: glycosyltransferase family 39 protein [Terracidiphilus sp.]|nr:glycosyltransferase family 39 protein [Terracidiphilus sp.]
MPPSTVTAHATPAPPATRRADTAALLAIAAAAAILHIATNGRYGFHRDELQFLSDARHLEWGFVAYPPMTPFIEHIALDLFGLSLVGLRLFSVLAQAIVIVVAGLMARDLGGGRLAQITVALAVALSPLPIFEATEFQYTSFAMLWWIFVCWLTIRLLQTENPRWWLAIGAVIGFGLLTKYSIIFFIAGLIAGLILTRARRYFLTSWFWVGVAIAFLIFLPNLVWLIRHDFISYHFLQFIHKRDVTEGRAAGYWKLQFLLDANLFALPLAAAGLVALFRNSRYRMLFWMSVVPVLAFWIGKGRFYYVAEVYPVLIAMGAVVAVQWLSARVAWARRTVTAIFFAGLLATGAYFIAMLVPIATSGPLRDFALKNDGDLREEIGWNEFVRAIAGVRDSLSPQQRANFGILVGNYGEAGAIENLGPAYQLPPPISLTNSFYLRTYPSVPPSTLIVAGWSREQVDREFTGCRLAGHNGNTLGIKNEESQDHPDIYVCGPPRRPWPDFWKHNQRFG